MESGGDYRVYRLTDESRARLVSDLAAALAERNEVAFAYLYGSAATEVECRDIDIGVAVGVEEGGAWPRTAPLETWKLEASLVEALAPVVEGATGEPIPVDVRVIDGAPVAFQYRVLRGRRLIVRDESKHLFFLERVPLEYFDLQPLRERALREVLSR